MQDLYSTDPFQGNMSQAMQVIRFPSGNISYISYIILVGNMSTREDLGHETGSDDPPDV